MTFLKNDLEQYKQTLRLSAQYFLNFNMVETAWEKLKESNFPREQRDKFWQLCIEGRRCFWEWTTAERKLNPRYSAPPTVPCYKRAVMLLEHEERWETAIEICKDALQWIDSTWYSEKIKKFEKKKGAT